MAESRRRFPPMLTLSLPVLLLIALALGVLTGVVVGALRRRSRRP